MVDYFYDCYNILNKVYGEKAFIKQAIADTVIEEKNRALTVKTCYGVLDKDVELSFYMRALADKTPKLPIRTILKISMYAVKYLNKKEYAVTKNAVELTKKLGKGGASGFVNAFLRKFATSEIPLPAEPIENLSVRCSFPLFLTEEVVKDYGWQRAERILKAENGSDCLSFYGADGEEYLKSLNVNYQKTPFENVFTVKNFVRNKDYDAGVYTYQALGSVAICEAVEPCENLLDCCAAPGGKSIRLSFKCGKVTSWDIHPHRVKLIEEYKARMKRENVFPKVRDAKVFDPDLTEKFDAVLVDAPCSGTGVTSDNPDIKLNRTKEGINELCAEQLSILKTASSYVKKGGFLYYSTCSILSRENIGIINAFMSDVKGFEMCPINSLLPHDDLSGANAFLPDISGGQGFFIAKMKRVK